MELSGADRNRSLKENLKCLKSSTLGVWLISSPSPGQRSAGKKGFIVQSVTKSIQFRRHRSITYIQTLLKVSRCSLFNTCWIFGLFKALFEISHGKCFTCLSALLLCNLLCCREKCAFLNTEVAHCHYVAAICLLADEKKGLINAGWRRRHRLSWPRVRREHWKSEMTSLDTVECTGEDGSKRRRGKERREEVEAVRSVSGRCVTFLRPMATQPPTLSGRRGVSAAGNRGLDMILSSLRLQSCGFVSHTACSWQHWSLADLASSWCFFFVQS